MAFTTWAALETLMLDDLAAMNWGTKSYVIGTRTVVFRDLNEFTNMLKYVHERAQNESVIAGTTPMRTYARNGGRC